MDGFYILSGKSIKKPHFNQSIQLGIHLDKYVCTTSYVMNVITDKMFSLYLTFAAYANSKRSI